MTEERGATELSRPAWVRIEETCTAALPLLDECLRCGARIVRVGFRAHANNDLQDRDRCGNYWSARRMWLRKIVGAAPLGSRHGKWNSFVDCRSTAQEKPYWVPFAHGLCGCGDVCDGWRRLAADAPPFLQPEFFDLTLPIADPAGEPYLAVAVRAGQVAGVLPVTLQGRDLHPLRSDHSPRHGFWGDSGALAGIWEALRADPRWDRFVVGRVPAASPLATELPMLARRWGCFVKTSPGPGVPYFALPGFEQQLDPKFRTNVRRCTRKAGDLSFERHTAPSPEVFADALAIEALRWKGEAGTSISSDARLMHFYRSLLDRFGPRGTMSLNFVTVAGQRIACLFAMEDGHTLYAAKIGYDPAYAAISPGHLMVAQSAADAERRGLKVFDFLGAATEWKVKWTDRLREHVWVVVQRPSLRGYARFALRKARESRLTRRTEHPRTPMPSSN
jgi:CelD/BcsL family acetyltransferase involved in cellulose biosynthesis